MKPSTRRLNKMTRAAIVALAVVLFGGIVTADKGSGSNQVRKIQVGQSAGKTIITVVGTRRPTYTAFKLSSPKRLVVDLANSHIRGVPSVLDRSTALVDGVAVSQFSTGGVPVARVMINFKKEAAYRVKVKGKTLVISLSGAPSQAVENSPETNSSEVEMAVARAQAANTQEKLVEAVAEIDRMKTLSADHKSQAQQARQEAQAAKEALAKARLEQDKRDELKSSRFEKATRQTEKKIARLENEIERARKIAKAEEVDRERLEKKLRSIQEEIEVVRAQKKDVVSSRDDTRRRAQDLKKDMKVLALAAATARKEAQKALLAQKNASSTYKKAADGERAGLLKVLKRREKETVEAKKRLSSAEQARDLSDEKVAKTVKELRAANETVEQLEKKQSQMETRARRDLAKAEKKREQANKATATAMARAAKAELARKDARAEVARLKETIELKGSRADAKASEKVAAAIDRVAKAQKARSESEKKFRDLEDRIAKADDVAGALEDKLVFAEREIRVARLRARRVSKAAAAAKADLENTRSKLEDSDKRVALSKTELETAKKEIADRDKYVTLAKNDLRSVKRKLKGSDKRVALSKTELEIAKKEIADRDKRVTRSKTELEIAKKEIADRDKRVVRAKEELESTKKKISDRDERVARAKDDLRSAKDKLKRRDERVAQAKAELEIAKREIAEHEKRVTRAKKDLWRMKSKLKGSDKRVALSRSDLAIAKKEIADRDKRVTRAKDDLRSARRKMKGSDKRVVQAKAELEIAKKEIADRDELVARSKAELEIAKKEIADRDKRVARANDHLRNAKSKLKGSDERFLSVNTKLSKANSTIAEQEKEISTLHETRMRAENARVKAAGSKSMTQEDLRLLRLAQMRGWDKTAASQDSKKPATVASAVTDIRFVNEGPVQRILISTNSDLKIEHSQNGKKKATLLLNGADLGPLLERTLDVTDFGGAIDRISSYKNGDDVKFEVELGKTAKNVVRRNGNTIEWIFTTRSVKSAVKSAVKDKKMTPLGTDTRTIDREDASAYDYPMDRTAAYAVKLKKKNFKKKKFTGRKIDLDFKDADIHNILRLLSDVGHVNIVTADDVSGSVTIRMRNVPWDQALDVILMAKKLGMVRDGNLIRVAPLATLEKEREMEIARRKQSKALEPLETRLIPVSYAQAGELQPRANDLLSERGKLSVDSRTNVIIARDTASNLDQIESLIRNLDTQTPQVLIEGRIVEASSTYAREIGIQWGGDFSASAATANPTGLAFPSTVGVAGGATDNQTPVGGLSPVAGGRPNPNFAVNLPAAAGTGSGGALGITLGSIANNANLNLRLSAMEEEGTLRILSSPKILTLDNRQAHIEQGTLIPYSRISAQGIQTAFKEAKLNLTVTPHVTADGSVLLKIKMTRDEPDFNNKGARGDPTILKREAETELLVSDGHTAVIGGIYTRNHGTSYKKVPFFGDIPILGWLFKSRSDSDRRSEMLIFITPRIVNRAESIGT